MVTLASEGKCTGCMACVQCCPKQAIHIYENSQGFLLPEIDTKSCISCTKCEQTCPILRAQTTHRPQKAYAVWSLDDQCRKDSASGGAAAELYKTALQENWWICGAAYGDTFHVKHILTREPEMVSAFQQSKYVYAEVDDIYCDIKRVLERGDKVLFISLPCKVAGLKGYLGNNYPGLVTVDIVCHGTPSYRILHDHIMAMQKGQCATDLMFRQDNEFIFSLKKQGKPVYSKIGRQDTYLAAFLEGLDYRESCYQCPFAKPERVGDLTICDFWGLGTKIPFDHPYTGAVSAVLINTEKGTAFFEYSRQRFFVEERPVEEAIEGNRQLNEPTPIHSERERFKQLYDTVGFESAVEKCLAEVISKDRQQLHKRQRRRFVRKLAGVFIKRYRS